MKQDGRTATKKAATHKRLSEQSKQKAGNLTQQVHDLGNELEGIRNKANNEVDNLKSLLNVDYTKKKTLENRVEALDNTVVDIYHDCAEATEELAAVLLV